MFMDKLFDELNQSVTENGALGYKTSGKALLDLNFAVSSLRSATEQEILDKFKLAFYEDKKLALKWLFYLRDIRFGLGERRTFRIILRYLAENCKTFPSALLELIPEYGRFDDLFELFDTPSAQATYTFIGRQLKSDISAMQPVTDSTAPTSSSDSLDVKSPQKRANKPKAEQVFEGETSLTKAETVSAWAEFGGDKLAVFEEDGSATILRETERQAKKTGVCFKLTEQIARDIKGRSVISWKLEVKTGIRRRKPTQKRFQAEWQEPILAKIREVENYPDVVSVEQLQEMLSVGKNTAYNLISSKAIKSFKIGRKIKIPKACILEYFIEEISLGD